MPASITIGMIVAMVTIVVIVMLVIRCRIGSQPRHPAITHDNRRKDDDKDGGDDRCAAHH